MSFIRSFLFGIWRNTSLLNTRSTDLSGISRGPGLTQRNFTRLERPYFATSSSARLITNDSVSIPNTDFAPRFFLRCIAAPPHPQPISRTVLAEASIPFMTSSISSVPPGERNPSPHTVFNKFSRVVVG